VPRVELIVPAGEIELPAVLRLPDPPPRAGVVTLHPASGPNRDYFLFEHLASLLVPRGIAVLSYDRRASSGLDDVPFGRQADDALAAIRVLRERMGAGSPIGLWAFSQGTWAAPIAATRSSKIAFLALVGAPGVSPAEQMRYSAAEALRRAGYDDDAVFRAVATRAALEGLIRRGGSSEAAQRVIDDVADEPWFELLYLPRTLPDELPAGSTWTDMDFDPAPVLREVRCPVLLVYGDDEAVPVEQSVDVWRTATAHSGTRLDVVQLPRSTHLPTIGGEDTRDAVDPEYEQALVSWLDDLVA
jgi:pimeloyl-ACP methyl ester carboxylesterase